MKWFYEEVTSKKIDLDFNLEALTKGENSTKYSDEESLAQLIKETEILAKKEIENYKLEIAELQKNITIKDNIIEALNEIVEESKSIVDSINNDKKKTSPNLDYDKNIYEVGITEQEGLIWGRIFVNFINSGKMHYAVKYFAPDIKGIATEKFSIGEGLFQQSNFFNLFTKRHIIKSTVAVLNNDYDCLNLVIKYDRFRFGTPSILLTKLLLDIKKQFQFQQGDSEYIENGHYLIEELEYMSIWTYKCKHKVDSINTSSVNGSEAIKLLNSNIANYHSKPDFGNFGSIRLYPVTELRRFYNRNVC